MGDFNNLPKLEEMKEGAPYPNWFLQGFRDSVFYCNLSDIFMIGYSYTWCRGRMSMNLVEERLDRAIANPN